MDINCFAFVELARMFYSGRISNEGASIVAISSIASLTMEPGMVSEYTYLPGLYRYAGFSPSAEQTSGGICDGSRTCDKLFDHAVLQI